MLRMTASGGRGRGRIGGMARSEAGTVAQYLKELPAEKRKVVAAVRKVIRKHLPKGYRESMGWGMIAYSIPLSRYPDTYNGQPLSYAALAAQKGYYALYLMSSYWQAAFLKREFKKAGKKLDMGRSCIRFRSLEDLPLEAIGRAVAGMPVSEFIRLYEKSRPKAKGRSPDA
jgi:hypothetical protein